MKMLTMLGEQGKIQAISHLHEELPAGFSGMTNSTCWESRGRYNEEPHIQRSLERQTDTRISTFLRAGLTEIYPAKLLVGEQGKIQAVSQLDEELHYDLYPLRVDLAGIYPAKATHGSVGCELMPYFLMVNEEKSSASDEATGSTIACTSHDQV
ncbi:unnamed protein product [Heligmosomoides polygyrus]|uniref:Oxidored_molyb domain-containing protein n=1 Tax=Heligmosomoides polygyrus TaxID=6339 RepID=A0A183F6V1_HELPZ|nr:unnamed protein product [Heligmosomoides polygyrus]